MTSFGVTDEDSLNPRLCVLSSGRYRCEGCIRDYGVKLRNIDTRFYIKWSVLTNPVINELDERVEMHDFNALEQFISFILELSSDWWGSELNTSDDDPSALASISAIIPIVPDEDGPYIKNAKKLLRRSYSSVKQLVNDQIMSPDVDVTQFDIYDILTEEHFQDALALIRCLKPELQAQVSFCFKTDYMKPTICYLHHGSIRRHMHNWKRKGFALLLRVKSLLSLHGHSARIMTKFTSKLHEVYCQLPEINCLLQSGLYSRNYIEQEINEVYSTVTDSVIKGFQTLKL